jgi:glycosyltransferase involved in cell wall biosynthesis
MKPLITVVVPIYGTEKYLNQCVQSILNQTLKNIEIICIDDCSPDNSVQIVERFKQQDARVKLIRHKNNTGQGGARNTGIIAAQADFIASVDSDDSIKPNMLEVLWEASDNGRFDIVCCGYSRVDEYGKEIKESKFARREIIRDQILKNSVDNIITPDINIFTLMNPSIWNKLWRKSLFTDSQVFFPHKLYYQDMATIPLLVANAKKIKFIDESLYNYLVRGGSVTTTFSDKHIIDYFKIYGILFDQLNRLDLDRYHTQHFFEYIDAGMIFHSTNVVNSNMLEPEKQQYLRHLLMLKVSFIETHGYLVKRSQNNLLLLLKTSSSIKDILPEKPKVLEKNKNEQKKISNHKVQCLSRYQIVGSRILGGGLFFVMPSKLSKKLKNNPVGFFSDSSNKFIRFIGRALKII